MARKEKVFFYMRFMEWSWNLAYHTCLRIKWPLGNSSNPGFLCLVTSAQDAFQDLLFCLVVRCSTQYCTNAQGQPCSQGTCCLHWLWAAPHVRCGSRGCLWPSLTRQGLDLAKLSPWSSGAAESTSPVAIASDISAVLNYRS